MVKRVAREGGSFDFSRSSFPTLPVGGKCQLTRTSLRTAIDAYILPSPSIFGRGSCLPTTKKHCGRRGDRLCSPAHYASAATPPASGGGSLHFAYGYKLSLTTTLSTRHLRLPFRLVRTGICTPFSNRREPPSASNLPPDRGLMNARKFAGGTRYIIRQGQVCSRL